MLASSSNSAVCPDSLSLTMTIQSSLQRGLRGFETFLANNTFFVFIYKTGAKWQGHKVSRHHNVITQIYHIHIIFTYPRSPDYLGLMVEIWASNHGFWFFNTLHHFLTFYWLIMHYCDPAQSKSGVVSTTPLSTSHHLLQIDNKTFEITYHSCSPICKPVSISKSWGYCIWNSYNEHITGVHNTQIGTQGPLPKKTPAAAKRSQCLTFV